MNIENIIKALEYQRNAVLTQNVELLARNMELEARIAEIEKNSLTEVAEVPDVSKKT